MNIWNGVKVIEKFIRFLVRFSFELKCFGLL